MAILHHLPCAVLVTSTQGAMQEASAEMVDMLLGGGTDWVGNSMEVFLPPASRVFLQTHFFPLLHKTGSVREGHLKLRGSLGEAMPALVNAQASERHGQPCFIWVFFIAQDRHRFERELIAARAAAQTLACELAAANAELLAAQAQLQREAQAVQAHNLALDKLSQTDALTGLGNRRMLEAAFSTWQSNKAPAPPPSQTLGAAGAEGTTATAALLMVDADHFKHVNDRWGHAEGDRVLVLLASTLQNSVRRNDSVVRHGGEEFVVFLPDADNEVAMRVAAQIHTSVKSILPGLQSPPLTVSIGVATLLGQAATLSLECLVHLADTATYQAKALGRNRTVVAPPNAERPEHMPTKPPHD